MVKHPVVSISVFRPQCHAPRWFPNEGRYSVEKFSATIHFVPPMSYEERDSIGWFLSFGSQTLMSSENHLY